MLTLVTAPALEPTTVDDVREHLRLGHSTSEEGYITNKLIPAARQEIEARTRRALITQSWTLTMDGFPGVDFYVPWPPLISVGTIKYDDTDGTEQTWTATEYVVTAPNGPFAPCGRISLAYGQTWPSTYSEADAVRVAYSAGYGAAASAIPKRLVMALLYWVGVLYRFRDAEIPQAEDEAFNRMLGPYKVRDYMVRV